MVWKPNKMDYKQEGATHDTLQMSWLPDVAFKRCSLKELLSEQDSLQTRCSPYKMMSKHDCVQTKWCPNKTFSKNDGVQMICYPNITFKIR